MARDWEADFNRNADRIAEIRGRMQKALADVHGSKDANDIVPSEVLERFGSVHKEWEAALEESQALLNDFRRQIAAER